METFFDYLKSVGLTEKRFGVKLFKLTNDEVKDLIINGVGLASLNRKIDRDSNFNFVANSTLSGGSFPCAHLKCRIKSIDSLARNSILYADTVSITNPFEQFVHVDEFSEYARYELCINLALLYYTKPLFDSGIFQLSSSLTHVCKSCLKKMNAFTRGYQKKIDKAEENLLNIVLSDVSCTVKFYKDGTPYIDIEAGKDILDHPIVLNPGHGLPDYLRDKLKRRRRLKLNPQEMIDYGIAEMFITPIIDDLITQNHYSNYYNSYYLTGRNIDAKLISENQNKGKINLSNTISQSLDHSLPFIPSIDFKNIIKLRKKEGEAFQIYRSSLTNFLGDIKSKNYNIKEAFRDEIEPEINKINQTIKNSKKLLFADIAKDMLVGSTFVSVGLFSHFLPPNFGQVLAAAGGVNYVGKFGENVKKLATLQSEVKSNKYFFVWKLQKLKK
jgi:hypothetical protein